MKQIKKKLNKLDKELKFLQELEKTHIDVANNNNKKLIRSIKKENENTLQKFLIPILIIFALLTILTTINLAISSELYEQYHIEEECTYNE